MIVALGACKKDDKPADKPADKTDPAVKPADPAKPADAEIPLKAPNDGPYAKDLALLPIDSELVMGVDLEKVTKSELWKEYIAERVVSDSVKGVLDELKTKCELDAMEVVKSAAVGVKGLQGQSRDGVIVVHGLDKAKTTACADKIAADKQAKVEVTKEDEVAILKAKSDPAKVLAIAFVNDSTAVAVFGAKANAKDTKALIAAGSGVDKSARFVDMYNKLDTKESGWMLYNGRAKAFDQLGQLGLKVGSVFGSLNVTSGLVLDLRLRVASADQATQGEALMKQQLGAAAGMLKFDKVDVKAEGSDLRTVITVSAPNIKPMVNQLKALAKMMGGAGGGAGSGMAAP